MDEFSEIKAAHARFLFWYNRQFPCWQQEHVPASLQIPKVFKQQRVHGLKYVLNGQKCTKLVKLNA